MSKNCTAFLYNTSLFKGDLLQIFSKILGMVPGYGGDNGYFGLAKIGGIQPSTQPDFNYIYIGVLLIKIKKG